MDVELEWADERLGQPLEGVYYYVRIRQADGNCAWLSPWWIDLPETPVPHAAGRDRR